MGGNERPFALIVEGQESLARNLRAHLLVSWDAKAIVTPSAAAARAELEGGARPCAFLVGVHLPDERGLHLARHIRACFPLAAIAMLTRAEPPWRALDEADEIDAKFLRVPFRHRQLDRFVTRARSPQELGRNLHRAIGVLTLAHPLSPKERKYVEAKLASWKDKGLVRAWTLSRRTIESIRRSVLAKTGDHDLEDFLHRVWLYATADEVAAPARLSNPDEARRDETRRDETRRDEQVAFHGSQRD